MKSSPTRTLASMAVNIFERKGNKVLVRETEKMFASPVTLCLYLLIPILLFVYFFTDVITVSFMNHDEYRFFQPLSGLSRPHCCAGELVVDHYRYAGRFLAAELMRFYDYLPIKTINDLAWIRLALLIAIGVSCSTLFFILVRVGVEKHLAVATSILVFSVPGYVAPLSWLLSSAVVVATLPACIAFSVFLDSYNKRANYQLWKVSLLLFISFHFYPASSSIFFIPIACMLFYRIQKLQTIFEFFIRSCMIFLGTLAAYFVIHKLTIFFVENLAGWSWYSPNLSFNVTKQPFAKIKFFLAEVVPITLRLWLIKVEPHISLILSLAGLVLLKFIFINRGSVKSFAKHFVYFSAIFFGLAFVFNFQNLIPEVNFFQHRTITNFVAFTSLGIVSGLVFLVLNSDSPSKFQLREKCLTGATSVLAIFAMASSSKNVSENAENLSIEYEYVKSKINEYQERFGEVKDIFVYSTAAEVVKADPDHRNERSKLTPPIKLRTYAGQPVMPGGVFMQYPEYNYTSFREEWPAYVLSVLREKNPKLAITDICDANHQPHYCNGNNVRVAYNGHIGGYSALADDIRKGKKTLVIYMSDATK